MDKRLGKIFALSSNKGGVTKTTTTLQLGYGLARRGYKVCIIDADAQSNSTYSLLGVVDEMVADEEEMCEPITAWQDDRWLLPEDAKFGTINYDTLLEETESVEDENLEPLVHLENTLYEALIGVNGDTKNRLPLHQTMIQVPQQENLYLVPASIALSSADLLLAGAGGREHRLARAIEPIRYTIDYWLIDTPPNLGLLTVNAFIAAQDDGIIVPVTPQRYSVLGIKILENAICQIYQDMGISIPLFGVVIARVTRTKNSQQQQGEVRSYFRRYVFRPFVPTNEKVEEAGDTRQSIYSYAPSSTGAKAYDALVDAFLYRIELLASRKREEK
jgi:chromosome partitioning protein